MVVTIIQDYSPSSEIITVNNNNIVQRIFHVAEFHRAGFL